MMPNNKSAAVRSNNLPNFILNTSFLMNFLLEVKRISSTDDEVNI